MLPYQFSRAAVGMNTVEPSSEAFPCSWTLSGYQLIPTRNRKIKRSRSNYFIFRRRYQATDNKILLIHLKMKMHINFIGAVIALSHLAEPRSINLAASACPDPNTAKSFAIRQIAYLRYETSPYTFSPQLNTTQLVFEVDNENTGVSTGCACQNVMSSDGDWADDSHVWYACVDRTITVANGGGGGDGSETEYPVKTSVRVDWDDWRLTVNQTWRCEESVNISQFSIFTLTPTCTENISGLQYIKECTAPDLVVPAT
ncbi:hypothetical protein F4678DRAFT_202234 [Xylaria arbuscula]|nr:hypothetical protein F4678DRAFT_202234 [Xylaria arbuscula]